MTADNKSEIGRGDMPKIVDAVPLQIIYLSILISLPITNYELVLLWR